MSILEDINIASMNRPGMPSAGGQSQGGLGQLSASKDAQATRDRMSGSPDDVSSSLSDLLSGLKDYQPSNRESWLSFASNIARPTKYGTMGEVISNVGEGLAPIIGKQEALKQQYTMMAKQLGYQANMKDIPAYQMGQIDMQSKILQLQMALRQGQISIPFYEQMMKELNKSAGQANQNAGQQTTDSGQPAQQGSQSGQTTDSRIMGVPRDAVMAAAAMEGPVAAGKLISEYLTKPPTRLGEGAYANQGKIYGLPSSAPTGYQNALNPDGTWRTIPVGEGLTAATTSAGAIEESKKIAANKQTLAGPEQSVVLDNGKVVPNTVANVINAVRRTSNNSFQNSVRSTESGGNPNAVFPNGAMGEMQVMPNTQTDPGFGVTPAKDTSPKELQRVGNDYLNAMQQRYKNNTLAAIAYNWGPGNTDAWIAKGGEYSELPAETKNYVASVMTKDAINSMPKPTVQSATSTTVSQGLGPEYGNKEGAVKQRESNISSAQEYAKTLQDKAPDSRNLAMTLSAMKKDFADLDNSKLTGDNITPGLLAPLKNNYLQVIKAIGLPMSNQENEAIANATNITKLNAVLSSYATRAISARPAVMEFVTMLNNNPNIAMTRESVAQIIKQLQLVNSMGPRENEDFASWMAAHPNGKASPLEFQPYINSVAANPEFWSKPSPVTKQSVKYQDIVNSYNSSNVDRTKYPTLRSYVQSIVDRANSYGK